MQNFLMQGSYPSTSAKALINDPQDRAVVFTQLCESAGGKLLHFFFGLGESDWYVLAELPDKASAAAVSLAITSSGGVTNCKTTPLLTAAEGMAAMVKAKKLTFRPATGLWR